MKERHAKAQSFLGALAANSPKLPFEPTLLPELFASTSSTSMHSTAHIASLVERSQGLAARILRLANSAYYGMQTEVSSLSHAIRLLGLNEVRNLLLQVGITSVIRKRDLPDDFPFRELWEHQILTARLARALAASMPAGGAVNPEDMYTAGLLHDIGKTLLAANRPADWGAIHDLAACENIPFFRAEEDYWGIDHSVVGARLLNFWGIPRKVTEVVNWHHFPQHAQEPFKQAALLLAAANLLAHYSPEELGAENGGAACSALPESVLPYIPQTVDRAVLLASLAACYDPAGVRSLAQCMDE